MNTRKFYQDLDAFSEFSDAFNYENYHSIPDGCWIVTADIVNSTKAIEAGLYKNVNFVGSLPIIATINLLTPLKFPYIFGGDGATLVIHEADKQQVLDVLIATAQFAKKNYDLQYRLGVVNIKDIRRQGCDVQIAKFNVSKNYQQAFFIGGGLSLAETLVKQDSRFQIDVEQIITVVPDFSGLECRWQDLFSPKEKVLSILIEATDNSPINNQKIYQELLQFFEEKLGNKTERSAVTKENLIVSLSPKQLIYEAKASNLHKKVWLTLCNIIVENIIGKFLMQFAISQWRFYKENMLQTTDAEKLDDTLRMVIASTQAQQNSLIDYLEQQYQAGRLVYGIHSSNRALMTCLIFERHGQQVHFIDAADGGYALAAKAFKKRKAALLSKQNS